MINIPERVKKLYKKLVFEYGIIKNGLSFSFSNNPGIYFSTAWILDNLNEFHKYVGKLSNVPQEYVEVVNKVEEGLKRMVQSARNLPKNWFSRGGYIRTEKDKARKKRLEAILDS